MSVPYQLVSSGEVSQAITALADSEWLACDSETTGLDPYISKPRLLILKGEDTPVFLFDLFQPDIAGPVISFLKTGAPKFVGQNLTFDCKMFRHHYGLNFETVWDTHRASRLIHNGLQNVGHDLYVLYKRELGIDPPAEDLGASDWSGELGPKQLSYAAGDVYYLHTLKAALDTQIKRLGLEKALEIENGVVCAEAELELAGMPFDAEAWTRLANNNIKLKGQLTNRLFDLLPNPNRQLDLFGRDVVGAPWNLDSPAQLLKSLQTMGYKLLDTSDDSLATLEGMLGKLLRDYREVSQGVKMFGLDYLKFIHPVTGRIHARYWPFTAAGRYSCSHPNLQQVVRPTDPPRPLEYRECFRPAPGHKFVIADYSQVELRVCAHLSQDPRLLEAYRNNEDIHTKTAVFLTGRSDKTARQMSKPMNFGLIFSLGAERLKLKAKTDYGVDLSLEQASYYRDKWFENYSGVRKWQRRTASASARTKPSRTVSGRLRYIDPTFYGEFLNSPIQGTAAEATKVAMRNVYDSIIRKGKGKLCNVVHDELVLEVEEGLAKEVAVLLKQAMESALQPMIPSVPAVAEAKVVSNWSEK